MFNQTLADQLYRDKGLIETNAINQARRYWYDVTKQRTIQSLFQIGGD